MFDVWPNVAAAGSYGPSLIAAINCRVRHAVYIYIYIYHYIYSIYCIYLLFLGVYVCVCVVCATVRLEEFAMLQRAGCKLLDWLTARLTPFSTSLLLLKFRFGWCSLAFDFYFSLSNYYYYIYCCCGSRTKIFLFEILLCYWLRLAEYLEKFWKVFRNEMKKFYIC